jgi:hypothetical protein
MPMSPVTSVMIALILTDAGFIWDIVNRHACLLRNGQGISGGVAPCCRYSACSRPAASAADLFRRLPPGPWQVF